MMKHFYFILLLFFCITQSFSQKTTFFSQKNDGFSNILTVKIDESLEQLRANAYHSKMKTPIEITSIAIAWQTTDNNYQAGNFNIKFRLHKDKKGWTNWQFDDCLVNPEQNPDGLYKSDLLFGWDEGLHDSIEFYLYPPENEDITEIFLICQDISGYLLKPHSNEAIYLEARDATCPAFPEILMRNAWCGTNSACLNPGYSPTYRPNMYYSVIHHGASPASYSDGAAVVYSYWSYHVNSNGWEDIGYNYLFDKYGNLFQGRYNPQLPDVDVHTAHAGYSNTYSIGLNFLGDSDASGTAPTLPQITKACQLLAWWYDKKGLDPESDTLVRLQPESNIGGNWITKPRICGHRDVNPGGTTCPGNTLYAILPSMRTLSKNIINDCLDNEAPSTEIQTEKDWQNADFKVHFEDYDSQSGVKQAFFQVNYNEENVWKSNSDSAFLDENFSNLDNWTIVSGDWQNLDNEVRINTNLTNAIIYSPVNQFQGTSFLYSFKIKFNAFGNNTRAGLHILCNDAENAGFATSYMIYLREHNNKIQIYRYGEIDGVEHYYYATNDDAEINVGVYYDIKVLYNTLNGKIEVYKDNVLATSWQCDDALFWQSGKHLALRAAECDVSFDDVKIYRKRFNNEIISLDSENGLIPVESENETSPAGKISTILQDNIGTWSELFSKDIFVDKTPATTATDYDNQIVNSDFTINFDDEDNASGTNFRFYLIADFDGENWYSNGEYGFAYDEFSSLDKWTPVSGNWNLENNVLMQSDETNANTQIYLPVNQGDTDEYLYDFDLKISGDNNTHRAGLHFFSSSTESNRGNGYFIWFRLQYDDLEFYKVENNVYSQVKVADMPFSPDVWHNVKIYFNKTNGKQRVYTDNIFIAEWIDESPFQSGNYVSFRTGNALTYIDNFKIYTGRDASIEVLVGEDGQLRYSNPNTETAAGKVCTLTFDNADNISTATCIPIFVLLADQTKSANYLVSDKIVIFPNPVKTELQITNYELRNGETIEIYDITGKLFITYNISHITSIDVSRLPSGTYFLHFGNAVVQFVKQ